MKKIFILPITLILLFIATSCKKNDDSEEKETNNGEFELKLEHVWKYKHGEMIHESDFELNKMFLQSDINDSVKISKLKYYISNITLTKLGGQEYKHEGYYLVNIEEGTMPKLTIKDIPNAEYIGVSFLLGVDSVKNVSGAQAGDLSPSKEMFWNWNTGYIFTKIEGSRKDVKSDDIVVKTEATSGMEMGDNFVYHIGGFSGENNALQTVNFSFGETVKINQSAKPSVHLMVNVSKVWSDGVQFTDYKMVHMPGTKAKKISKSFSSAFELDHVHK